ncbi:cul-3 [Pristionchus pacificus]|uniref:Cul-3 n=1 Tax=Pristionchus pacificus TaxID=54126 RepID=A0A2A6CZU5_PRIPA|nr:cul-3 [Pristionchus pacificus]|eukprot:PDM83685.1 cul-3 [Pristionchus pacificus]
MSLADTLSAMSRTGAAASSTGNNRMRIRAFPTAMDEAYVDQTLTMLQDAIKEIQRKNNGGLSFEELYRNAYTMVLHKHGEKLYNALRDVVREHLRNAIRKRVGATMDDRFLETLNSAWSEHTTAMVMIRDIFMYMDRVYVEQQKCDPVYNLGIGIFRDEIVRQDRVSEHLRKVLLEMVADERAGITVKWSGIKSACTMLVALGIEHKHVYEGEFEVPFLKETSEYYKAASQKFLSENCASVYVKKVENCIAEETDRAMRYLDKDTKNKLLSVLENTLITTHMQTVVDMENSGLKVMMRDDKVADMRALYLLLRRVPNGLTVMTSCMSEYLRAIGEKLVDDVEGVGAEGADAAAAASKKDPVRFIQELIDLKERFDHFLKDAFDNDSSFKNKIQSDFEFFFNKNKRSPEFLSLYIDDKLKKGQKCLNDNEMESMLDRSMVLFRFLSEKDAFEKYYKQHVAKRLLLDKSVSDDAEKQMITKLKTECGCQFTQRLESMFKDKEIWGTLAANFKDYCTTNPMGLQMDVGVRVLTAGIWPTQSAAPQCVLPDSCQAAFDHFKQYYVGAHNGRKITLNTLLGSADIKAIFYGATPNADELSQQESEAGPSSRDPAPKRKEEHKILQVNTHTMILLMRFNIRHMFTFNQLKEDTQIPERDLQRCLQSLSMGKPTQRILTRKGKGKEIEDQDEFTVNDLFTSKLTRIRIQNVTNKSETEPERKETRNKIDEDRKHEVEAAIVRIMKARKTLQHNDLVVEVTEQLQSRFKPDPQLIKMRIESLIEREYLKRSEDNHRVYQYQA